MNPDLKLMSFQEEGSTLLAKTERAMLVWDAGIGKTPTAVRACAKARAQRILVFCPPIATGVWRQHFVDWSEYQVRVFNADWNHIPGDFLLGYGARVIPYSRAHPHADVIHLAAKLSAHWDAVILDEAHYLKNPEALRSQAVYGHDFDLKDSPLQDADRIWCLTGTPLLNNPSEFWTHLHALAPETIILGPTTGVMGHMVFTERYCVTKPTRYGFKILGTRNGTELANRIKPFAFRKRAKDVLLDLPPLRIVEQALPADTPISDELADMMTEFINDLGADATEDEILTEFQNSPVAFSTMRRLVGMAKAPGVAAIVDDILEDAKDQKVIVFAHHRDVIAWLYEQLKGHRPLVITGETRPQDREARIKIFQESASYRLIILAIEAAGEAITLHAARNVVIAEPSPVPAKNHQAIARAHRKGQVNPVLARFVTLPGGLDALLTSIIARKTRGIAQVVDADLASLPTELFPEGV